MILLTPRMFGDQRRMIGDADGKCVSGTLECGTRYDDGGKTDRSMTMTKVRRRYVQRC